MIRTQEDHLAHYGILRRSGRYPWGSGGTENVRNKTFLDTIHALKKEGMSDAKIAESFGFKTTDLRAARSIALAQQKQSKILQARRLKDKGWSHVAIGERMGLNESSVRALLADGEKDKADALQTTANMLKKQVDEKKYIDVGVGTEHQVGVTRTRLDTAVAVLKEQGYPVHNIHIATGDGKFTTMKVVAPPGTPLSEIQKNRGQIRQISEYSNDHGRSYLSVQTPISIKSKRVAINYAEDGGADADGVIYVRPGVKDLSIGSSRYAQVRIAVDGTHYLKGMAVYKDDLPEGVDLVFNTNKHNTGNKKDAMKEIESDPELPFGSIVRQIHGPDGKVSSAMNIVGSPTKEGSGEEGSWDTWSRSLSSQMLSKQSPKLAEQQLGLTFERRKREFDEIMSLTNPTVRQDLLMKFGDSTDSAAVHLKAASMPRQTTRVILPIKSLKDTEVYAPHMRDGEQVALVRYPHGGTFEIPQLKVNNRNREARKLLGTNPADAIGINPKTAQRLSGADFDGDTVIVIPNGKKQIESTRALDGLKDFDPQIYKIPDDSPIPRITAARKGREMGKVSNLITDMTLQGARSDEIARAIRHSMVVIDAEKHNLNYLESEKANGILQLKEKYQGGKRAGASTIISRATADTYPLDRVPRPARRGGPIDPATGKKVYELTGREVPVRKLVRDPSTGKKTYVDTGKTEPKRRHSVKLAETDDAHTLVSDKKYVMEVVYADHSNRLKAMANQARKEAVRIKPTPYSPSARKVYAPQVASLTAKLNVAEKNAPYERQARLLANQAVSIRRQSNPHLETDELKKIKQQELTNARIRTGAKKTRIVLTQDEWDAIQAGAISNHKLTRILNNSDPDSIKMLAMPKTAPKMSTTMKLRAQTMLASGYTQAEVADQLGVGLTTLKIGLSE